MEAWYQMGFKGDLKNKNEDLEGPELQSLPISKPANHSQFLFLQLVFTNGWQYQTTGLSLKKMSA